MNRFLIEYRSEVRGNTLAGYAATFDTVADLGPKGYERLAPTAFDAALRSGEDVKAFLHHDPSKLLGSVQAGNLRLDVDDVGLRFELDLPDVSYAHDARELVRAGVLNSMSFGFMPGKDEWSTAPDGRQLRTHTSVARLLEISPVSIPAYDNTSLTLRAYNFDHKPGLPVRLIKAKARLLTLGDK
ncbi:MAG: HK97 family phage prohead protease [Actinomycetota bacterium]